MGAGYDGRPGGGITQIPLLRASLSIGIQIKFKISSVKANH